MKTNAKHPAKFSEVIIDRINLAIDEAGWPERILDPFAGTGRVHQLTQSWTCGVEIEPEWAALTPNTIVANTLHLPFADQTFDGMVTSPVYGNRYSDSHNARDKSERRSYTHDMGRKLHPDNSGVLPWGNKYRAFHEQAWTECLRVLKSGALIFLNVSDFYKTVKKERVRQEVSGWHLIWFLEHGCRLLNTDHVYTRRMRNGANRHRVECEYVFTFRYLPAQQEDRHDRSDVLSFPPLGFLADGLDT